jgi:hypothetical protein
MDSRPQTMAFVEMLALGMEVSKEIRREKEQEDYTAFCNDIERDFRSGMKVKNIAKKRGISKQRVITILKNKGLVGK